MSLGKRIRKLRKSMGKNTKDFSSIIGISQGSLSDIENEKTSPSSNTLVSISEKTDVCAYWLLCGKHNGICFKNYPEHNGAEIIPIMLKIIDLYNNSDENKKSAIQKHLNSYLDTFHHTE